MSPANVEEDECERERVSKIEEFPRCFVQSRFAYIVDQDDGNSRFDGSDG